MRISERGLDLIKCFEGFKATAYKCLGGVWTLGYGHTKGVKRGDEVTHEGALKLLKEDVRDAENAVLELVRIPLEQHEFDAIVSFVFNVGRGNFEKSALLRVLNQGDKRSVGEQLLRWKYAGGISLNGLLNRRRAEVSLFYNLEGTI